MSVEAATLTVSELLTRIDRALTAAVPGPVWVSGEISGFKRSSKGAGFFRLVDPTADRMVVEVAARGRIMVDIDRRLQHAGVGGLRDGIEVRIRAVAALDHRRSTFRLSLLEVDPEFIAGRLALDRQEVLRRLAADGTLVANGKLALPLVPLSVGLVTSRGSAAHADFLDQLRRSGYRFRVRTVQTSMQGEAAIPEIERGLARLVAEELDMVAIVRGGGARLDLAAFDAEEVGRAVARVPVPVIAGIGHETDRTVVDDAAAVTVKTPSAAGEWLVTRVGEFAGRIETARRLISDEARAACRRGERRLDHTVAQIGGARTILTRHRDALRHLESGVAERARRVMGDQVSILDGIEEMLETIGVEPTLARGFALVTDSRTGAVVRSISTVGPGDRLSMRLADGTVPVVVEETDDRH